MSRLSKKTLWIGLIVLLFLSTVYIGPKSTLAGTDDLFYYEYQYNEEYSGMEITQYDGEDEKVIVPEIIEGIPVTVIGERAFDGEYITDDSFGNDYVKEIVLPDTVKVIKRAAFASCYKLQKINLPEGLTEIPTSAFSGCTSLKKIVIPKNVVRIGMQAFAGCSDAKSLVIPKDSHLEIIDEGAFRQCNKLEEVKLPKSLKVLGACAFMWCTKLKKVDFGKQSQINEITDNCFFDCLSLAKITIPKNVKNIRRNAFFGCKKLKKITFKGSAPKIEKAAFKKIHSKAVFDVLKKYKSSFKKNLKKKAWYKSTMAIK